MDGFRIPLGSWVATGVDWIKTNLDGLLDVISFVVSFLVDGLTRALLSPHFVVIIVIAAFIAWLVRSWQLAIGTVISFGLIVAMGLWVPAMQTLALVLVAAAIAVLIAVPLGIWSARNATVRAVLKPVLDFMQTMPAFVYLIPAIVFFSIGVVPGLVATVIFALPPGVRLTELGIRGVDSETVEAGQAFGAKPGQILRGIQLPLAMPTILAGVNQVIMLALSMAVIAGMAGADGLGKIVVEAISTINIAKGVEDWASCSSPSSSTASRQRSATWAATARRCSACWLVVARRSASPRHPPRCRRQHPPPHRPRQPLRRMPKTRPSA